MRVYAIGDIHGYLGELEAAHRRIERDCLDFGPAPNQVVHIGDLVDRGPDSRGVIEFLIDGMEAGRNWVVIKGNHDRLFSNYIRTGAQRDARLRAGLKWTDSNMGGARTLASYGVEKRTLERAASFHGRAQEAVPEAHVAFIEALPLWHRAGELIFVHAGIKPGVALEAQEEDDLLWIRDGFLWDMTEHEGLVVHGHTPVDKPEHYGNRINLDAGAGYGRPLAAVVFEGRECFWLTDEGRVPVTAP